MRHVLLLLCLFSAGGAAAGDGKPVWLVVTRPMFREALAPLARHRGKQGLQPVISTASPAEAIRSLARRPGFVLLVGDAAGREGSRGWAVPPKQRKLYRWRAAQDKTFDSDAAWGDLDGDGAPDVPVGRIPVRTAGAARRLVSKILAYERRPASTAELGVPVWAGAPGYSEAMDRTATGLLVDTVRREAPRWSSPWLLSGAGQQVFRARPADQAALFCQRLRRGGLLACLVGHADRRSFLSVRHGGKDYGLDIGTVRAKLANGPPACPMVVLACHAGRFSQESECLAEALLHAPGGPAGAIAATTESHPLTNYFSGPALLKSLSGDHETLGELWHHAQRRAARAQNPLIERMLLDVEGKLEDPLRVDKLRRDQLLMYALLGDPATRLKRPLTLQAAAQQRNGKLHWSAVKPRGAGALWVGFRPEGARLPTPPQGTGRQPAIRAFREANARFAFRSVAKRTAGQDWKGSWTPKRAGTLRLVAEADGRMYVALLPVDAQRDAAPGRSR